MKIIGIVFAFVFLSSCQSSNQFEWLSGSWQRTNDEEGSQTYEYWEINGEEMKGMGCTIAAGDTVFKEDLRILKLGDKWMLEVAGPNETPVSFELTSIQKLGFEAENAAHDFPKKIFYGLDGEVLKASVSNEEMNIDFDFKPL